ncbi:unnamed protein product [Prunus armeniaca]|uniref:Uncharacterized protein n=1 Tax=Prunus armeniaca TaxID=36596 RepID=A0A6J5U272_PRUAR|nr:unnamed protein product [Prunus armeniaca]CAB4300429.1 unnamed protein product [Prunus armeniaca]
MEFSGDRRCRCTSLRLHRSATGSRDEGFLQFVRIRTARHKGISFSLIWRLKDTKWGGKKHASVVSWPCSMLNMIVFRSTAMNLTPRAPVLRSLVHFIAISTTVSCKGKRSPY